MQSECSDRSAVALSLHPECPYIEGLSEEKLLFTIDRLLQSITLRE